MPDMEIANLIFELLKYVLPAGVVLVGVKLVLDSQENKAERKERLEVRSMAISKLIPLRLQAYERAILYLERISPENLLIRVQPTGKSAKVYQQELTFHIRSEYDHNMAQQLYVTAESWMALMRAKEQILALINQSGREIADTANGGELGRRIVEKLIASELTPTNDAIAILKKDIQKTFRLIP